MNYYNENDPKAAAWLRELILAGQISHGDVDQRSITDVKPHELTGYTQQHFFAGIGGWPLALRLAGWPDDQPVWTGSCPCQPFSVAGKRKGKDDERDLWSEFRRLIESCRPETVFGEQVASVDVIGAMAGKGPEISKGLPTAESGARPDSARKVQVEEEENQLRLGLAHSRHPKADRHRGLRGERIAAEPGWWTDLGQPVHRSGEFQVGLHLRQHPGGLPCGEQCAGGLGGGEAHGDSASDYLEAHECVQRAIKAVGRELEAQDKLEWLARIQFDLERMHYAFGSCVLPAAGVSAPHIRQRLYWVANLHATRLQKRPANGINPDTLTKLEPHRDVSRLVQPNGSGRNAGKSAAASSRHGSSAEPASSTGGLGDSQSGGRGERGDASLAGSGRHIERAGWSRFDIVKCRDNKTRRFEPSSFPLAHGVPNRVGLLRGYGNAIVPQLAAEFIQASVEAFGRKAVVSESVL